jgi:hypothetical protein
MKELLIIFALFILYILSCKSKPAPAKLLKYYVLIDQVQKTEAGPVDTNSVDTFYCKDDKSAITKGLEKYYNAVVSTETRARGPEPALPYLLVARGWAVLDAQGENVKSRVSQAFVDSSNQQALELQGISLRTCKYSNDYHS